MAKIPVFPIPGAGGGGGIKWTKLFTRQVTGTIGGGVDDDVRSQYDLILVEVAGTATVNRSGYNGDSIITGTDLNDGEAPHISMNNGQRTIPRTTFLFLKGEISIDSSDVSTHLWGLGGFITRLPEGIYISRYITPSLTQTAYGGTLQL